MAFEEKKKLKNYFVLGFVPFESCFNKFIKPFILEMKMLEKGITMNIQKNICLVLASLGDITADLSQGNDLVG